MVTTFYLFIDGRMDETIEIESIEVEKVEEVIQEEFKKVGTGNFASLEVTNLFGNYAKASFVISAGDAPKEIFLIKSQNEWKIVEQGRETVSCERMEKYGFPATFIENCELEFPTAIKVSKLVEKIKNKNTNTNLVESETQNSSSAFDNEALENLEVVGVVSFADDPFCGCFDVTSDGQTVTVYVNQETFSEEEFENIQEGDQVVVTVSVNENESAEENSIESSEDFSDTSIKSNENNENNENEEDETDDVTIVANDVEEINEGVTNPNTENTGSQTAEESDESEEETENSNAEYDVTDYPPNTAPPPEFLQNLFDIDNSHIEIEIIGN